MKISLEKINFIFYRISIIILVIAATIALYYFYLIFFPAKILKINNIKFLFPEQNVRPGDRIKMTIDYCKAFSYRSFITVAFIDGLLVPEMSTITNFPVGCHVISFGVPVPLDITPGKWRMIFTVEYNANTFVKEHHEVESDEFFVSAPKKLE